MGKGGDQYRCERCSSVQFSHSVMSDSLQPHGLQHTRPPCPVHHQLLEFTQTHVYRVVMSSNHLILCHPFLLPPSIFPSIRIFSKESVLHIRWPTNLEFQLQQISKNNSGDIQEYKNSGPTALHTAYGKIVLGKPWLWYSPESNMAWHSLHKSAMAEQAPECSLLYRAYCR